MDKMKILIAYDGSSFSDAALEDLSRAGLPSKAETHVIAVSECLAPVTLYAGMAPATPSEELLSRQRNEAMKLAKSASRRIEQVFPDWVVSPRGYVSSTATEVLAEADRWLPDLIVVGSHGRSAVARFFLGSATMSVLHGADWPVRVVRGDIKREETPIRNIIGVDGSEFADAAVESVKKRVWPGDSEFRVITCYGSFSPKIEPSVLSQTKFGAEEIARKAVSTLKAAGLNASGKVLLKDPGHGLIEEAESWSADCIYVGARGLSAIDRLLLGSVSSRIAGHAPCSVEVVRFSG